VLIVSAVMLVSLAMVFQMVDHLNRWWRRQEKESRDAAAARALTRSLTQMISMAGYRSSERAIHVMEPGRLAVEYLDEGATEVRDQYSRHRLFTVRRDGDQVKLTTQRRRLPLDTSPPWEKGSTTVLAEGVGEFSLTYLDRGGGETGDPGRVRCIAFRFGFLPGSGRSEPPPPLGTAVALRNHRG
jgi:hypothetical protein